jgi:hypothetical protein
MKINKKLIIFLIFGNLMIFSMVDLQSQKIRKQVISPGGLTLKSSNIRINGTLGQTITGRVSNTNKNINKGLGFWNDGAVASNPTPYCLISIPKREAKIGDTIQIPLTLNEFKFKKYANVNDFEAKIRYNSQVLQPIGNTPNCTISQNDDCVITLNGSIKDTFGVLFNMEFMVRLGSTESTPLIIESFKWIKPNNVKILSENGELLVTDICKAGDTSRFVKLSNLAGIISVGPNPSDGYLVVNYTIRENAGTRFILINNLGEEILELFNGIPNIGNHSSIFDLSFLPSGLYNIVMVTPTQLFSKKLIINK